MSKSTLGERITAAASALAAIVILGAAVVGQQSRTAPVGSLARLESDLRFQLYLAHRTDGGKLAARLGELNRTLEAWQQSPRTAEDDRLLAEWLQASIERSMPGESGELPPIPKFGAPRSAPEAKAPAAAAPKQSGAVEPAKAPPPREVAKEPAPAPVDAPKPALATKGDSQPQKGLRVDPSPPAAPAAAPPVVEIAPAPDEPVDGGTLKARPASVTKTAPTPAPIEVNLAELNARIAGYHQGLAAVEAAIVAAESEMSAERLAQLVRQVEQLSHQYALVRLYFDSLTERERARATAPRPLRPTIELVDRERAYLEHGADGDFLAPFEVAAGSKETPLGARLREAAERSAAADAAR